VLNEQSNGHLRRAQEQKSDIGQNIAVTAVYYAGLVTQDELGMSLPPTPRQRCSRL
jgi:hypothetical protein